jgi:LysR family transcriptional activator of nhaA
MYHSETMERLNYHHLLYFWMVAREGTVARAATEMGRVVFRYADEIFALGRELAESVKGQPTGRPLRLAVGVADALPKLVAYRLIEPALALPQSVRLVVHEQSTEKLLAALALHELDVVLTDRVAPPGVSVRAFNHLLGDCGVTLFAAPKLAVKYRRSFPRALDGVPFLLPGETSTLRRALEQWFQTQRIQPCIIGEFDDSTLIKVFGHAGRGVFAAPSIIESSIRRQYGVVNVGRLTGVRAQFYAVSAERRLKHPAVIAITESARRELFG